MAFPSDYEGSIHRFVYEPNEKSLEAGDKELEASITSETGVKDKNTLTTSPSKSGARHVENVDYKGLEAKTPRTLRSTLR